MGQCHENHDYFFFFEKKDKNVPKFYFWMDQEMQSVARKRKWRARFLTFSPKM
jgi:hypothetical protein